MYLSYLLLVYELLHKNQNANVIVCAISIKDTDQS